ncbi:hypothetical protein EYR38_006151 [Pleurotus pulmonarius]|nr:hypothetical protein EYR38_006151 [Pleurotus pulmonarius]
MALSPTVIPDLTAFVTKQGVYPAAHGGFADIWLCTLNDEASNAQKIAVKVLRSLGNGFNDESKHEKCNILINGEGDACLSDFGLSTIISDIQGVSSFTSSIGGNVRFAAPELYKVGDDDARASPTTHSDIYSLGSIILQTLTGEVPYHYMKTDGQVLIELSREKTLNVSHGQKMEFWTALGEGGRAVAVKMFRLTLSVPDKDTVLQEMRDIGEVEHYHLLSYTGTTEYDGLPSIVMSLLPGHNLRAHLRNTSISAPQKLVLLRQIASGLTHLHTMDLVHGGLTGWNIIITGEGEAVLTNFGLMPILYRRIRHSEILETYYDDCQWADPALWFGFADGQERPSETAATDVYAFGRVVYQNVAKDSKIQTIMLATLFAMVWLAFTCGVSFSGQGEAVAADSAGIRRLWAQYSPWFAADEYRRPPSTCHITQVRGSAK